MTEHLSSCAMHNEPAYPAGPCDCRADAIASICHEANRAYCVTLGDLSQPTWAGAPEWQRASAIEGVRAKLANPALTPEQGHEVWLARKQVDGWTYGPIKNPELKQHPCCVPYGELPPNQRVKDALFNAIVAAFVTEQ